MWSFHQFARRFIRPPLVRWYRRKAQRAVGEFFAKTRQARRVQEEVLLEKLRRNAGSQFGRDHRFGDIRGVASFRAHVPIATYDYFAPYVERVKAGDVEAMFGSGQRLLMFSLSSGTTGTTKFIPITDHYFDEYRRSWALWGYATWLDHPHMLEGTVFKLVADWDEFRTSAGVPCGNISGLAARSQHWTARVLSSVPECIMKINDVRAKYYTAMRIALAGRAVSFAAAANPATLIGAVRLANEEKERLIRDIADGTLRAPGAVPLDVRMALQRRVRRPNPDRARELDRIIHRSGALLPKDYWSLRLLSNWIGGSMGAYLQHYPSLFGEVPVRDHGLSASEGRMNVPLHDGTSAGVLDIVSHFYEFIPEEEIDSQHRTVLLAHEIEEAKNYYLLLTTSTGLYRYHISDVVRCTGFLGEAPVVEFLNKGSRHSSITGEKLTEYQAVEAVRRGLEELSMAIGEFTLAACWDDPCYYALLIEEGDLTGPEQGTRLARRVEEHLQDLNVEYRSKRESLRLGPVQLRLVPTGMWERLDTRRREQLGSSAEQYKHLSLVGDLHFLERLPHVITPHPTPLHPPLLGVWEGEGWGSQDWQPRQRRRAVQGLNGSVPPDDCI